MSHDCDHDCNHCASGCPERGAAERKQRERIQRVVGVVSGKGGVGKSLVTSLLASEARRSGMRTGILDADITGPSIPKIFGLHEKVLSDGKNVYPAVTKGSIPSARILLKLSAKWRLFARQPKKSRTPQ